MHVPAYLIVFLLVGSSQLLEFTLEVRFGVTSGFDCLRVGHMIHEDGAEKRRAKAQGDGLCR